MQYIILGGGCFWCIEAVYNQIDGVISSESGYTGGDTLNPTYKDICSGTTNHVEVVKITFDDGKISLDDILEIFWASHDPTTLNRQGNDIGTQYRSAIFYNDENQIPIILDSIEKVAKSIYDSAITTQVSDETEFYPAEKYHQDYFANHGSQSYCAVVISPKVAKIRQKFSSKLKA